LSCETDLIKAHFRSCDKNGDGIISKDELKKRFREWSEKDCDDMFAAFDENKDGRVAYDEFVDWVMGSAQAVKVQLRAAGKINELKANADVKVKPKWTSKPKPEAPQCNECSTFLDVDALSCWRCLTDRPVKGWPVFEVSEVMNPDVFNLLTQKR